MVEQVGGARRQYPDAGRFEYTGIWFPKRYISFDPRTGAADLAHAVGGAVARRDALPPVRPGRERPKRGAAHPRGAAWRADWLTLGAYDDGWTIQAPPPGCACRAAGQRGPLTRYLTIHVAEPPGRPVTIASNLEAWRGRTGGHTVQVCVPARFRRRAAHRPPGGPIPGDQRDAQEAQFGTRRGGVHIGDIALADEVGGLAARAGRRARLRRRLVRRLLARGDAPAAPARRARAPRSSNGTLDHVEVLATTVFGRPPAPPGRARARSTGRDVRQREHLHARIARDLGGLRRCRVHRLRRPVGLVLAEGRLVDEQVGASASAPTTSDCAVSPVYTTIRPARGGPSTSAGVTVRPSPSVTASPRWSAPRSGPAGTPSVRRLDVEPAGAVGLGDGVPHG